MASWVITGNVYSKRKAHVTNKLLDKFKIRPSRVKKIEFKKPTKRNPFWAFKAHVK